MASHPRFIKGMQRRWGQIALILFVLAVFLGVISATIFVMVAALTR